MSLVDLPYHDAKLVSVEIEESGDIALSFVSESGQVFFTVLRGVQHFCCDNFREGNIVFARRADESKEAMIKDLGKLMFALPSDDSSKVMSVQKSIESGEFVFFKLISSYGANILAVCEHIDETITHQP